MGLGGVFRVSIFDEEYSLNIFQWMSSARSPLSGGSILSPYRMRY